MFRFREAQSASPFQYSSIYEHSGLPSRLNCNLIVIVINIIVQNYDLRNNLCLCSVVVAGLHLVYLDDAGTQLMSVSATGQSPPAVLQLPTPTYSLTTVASSADKVFVRVGSNLVAVLPENLNLVKTDVSGGIAVHSHSAGQHIIISVQNLGKVSSST